MKNVVIAFVFVLVLGLAPVYACTLAGKSATKFDPNEYVFIGKVIGYTDAVPFDRAKANGSANAISVTEVGALKPRESVNYGMIVGVVESVHLPEKAARFEVFEFALWADCSVTGVSKFYFPDKFPIGSEVRVISRKAEFVSPSPGDRIRLENKLDEDHDISLNTDARGRRVTSAHAVFDYKGFEADGDESGRQSLPIFELRKDLLRLSRAKTIAERHSILDRISSGPTILGVDHAGIFKDNTTSDAEYHSYYDRFLKERDPEFYVQYKTFNDVLERLVAKGYNKKEAEEAMGKALQAGTDMETSKLFEASLKILRNPKK